MEFCHILKPVYIDQNFTYFFLCYSFYIIGLLIWLYCIKKSQITIAYKNWHLLFLCMSQSWCGKWETVQEVVPVFHNSSGFLMLGKPAPGAGFLLVNANNAHRQIKRCQLLTTCSNTPFSNKIEMYIYPNIQGCLFKYPW